MNDKITFVLGGCRSGKSDHALDLANKVSGCEKYFIATSVPTDVEMEKRVEKHIKERGSSWHTVEEPVKIYDSIKDLSPKADVIIVDCLTLWVSNLMMESSSPDFAQTAVTRLEKSLEKAQCPVILVSNEVGLGIVPENRLARQFRDLAGFVNRRVAAAADRVVMTVAGIAVQIKPQKAQ